MNEDTFINVLKYNPTDLDYFVRTILEIQGNSLKKFSEFNLTIANSILLHTENFEKELILENGEYDLVEVIEKILKVFGDDAKGFKNYKEIDDRV